MADVLTDEEVAALRHSHDGEGTPNCKLCRALSRIERDRELIRRIEETLMTYEGTTLWAAIINDIKYHLVQWRAAGVKET